MYFEAIETVGLGVCFNVMYITLKTLKRNYLYMALGLGSLLLRASR